MTEGYAEEAENTEPSDDTETGDGHRPEELAEDELPHAPETPTEQPDTASRS